MITDKLAEKFPDMPNLRVRDIRVDKVAKKVYCVVSYPDSPSLSPEILAEIRKTVAECIPKNYRYDIRIVNDRFNEKSFAETLLGYVKKRYPIYAHIKADKLAVVIADFNIDVTIHITPSDRRIMEASEFVERLDEYFRLYTCYKVRFSLVDDVAEEDLDAAVKEQEKMVMLAVNKELLKPQRYFKVSNVRRHIGKEINARPMYISDIRSPMDSCVVCGRISEKELRSSKKDPTMKVMKFTLTDDSHSSLPCIMFVRFQIEDFATLKQTNTEKTDNEIQMLGRRQRLANENKMKKMAFLGNDLEVLVRGKVVYSSFSERLELQLYDICICKIEPLNTQPVFSAVAPAEYLLVKPTPLEEYRQMTLLDMQEKPSVISDKKLAVLCVNVTGNNFVKDKIFSICAVKLENGHLREKLFTFVSPEINLTPAQMSEAKVTEKQLMVSPTLTEIVPDLYKFLEGTTLVGKNLSSMCEMLNYYAAPLGYSFNNELLADNELISTMFDQSIFENKPNCSVVPDVLKVLKISCPYSESSEERAVAVAQILSLLAQKVR